MCFCSNIVSNKKHSDFFMTGFVAINFHNHFLLDTMSVASSLFVLGIMHSYRAQILTCSHSLHKFDL